MGKDESAADSMSDLKDSFANLCKKCNSEPCVCDSKPLRTVVGDVCNVCHRHVALCICKSHHDVRVMNDGGLETPMRPARPYSKQYIETLVNEAMLHYYQRDAEGLARWIRRVLP